MLPLLLSLIWQLSSVLKEISVISVVAFAIKITFAIVPVPLIPDGSPANLEVLISILPPSLASVIEFLIQIWIKLVNKKFQWLITSKDEKPKLSKLGLDKFF